MQCYFLPLFVQYRAFSETWHAGVRKGKRSALVDHQTKNKEHKQLVQDMELGLKRVMLVGGVAQRLLGKVAIITGWPPSRLLFFRAYMSQSVKM